MLFEASNCLALSDLTTQIGESEAKLICDNSKLIRAIAPVSQSGSGVLSFSNFTLTRTLEKFDIIEGAILIVKASKESQIGLQSYKNMPYSVVEVENPRRYFFQAVHALFGDLERSRKGIHKFSVVASDAKLGDDVFIGPFVSVDAGCEIRDKVALHHGVLVTNRSVIGENTIIRANSVVGVPGQAIERDHKDQQIVMPHLGRAVLGRNIIVGANSVLVTGSLEDTEVGDGVMIGNQVNIGHNCKIGEHCFIAPQVVIAGSVNMGRRCWVAPGARVLNKLSIGDNVMIGLGAIVTKSIKEGTYVFGNPAVPLRKINRYNK